MKSLLLIGLALVASTYGVDEKGAMEQACIKLEDKVVPVDMDWVSPFTTATLSKFYFLIFQNLTDHNCCPLKIIGAFREAVVLPNDDPSGAVPRGSRHHWQGLQRNCRELHLL